MRCLISHTNLGKNIRYLRRQKSLSLEDFSEKLGIAPTELNIIETADIIDIDGELLQIICIFFHTDMETLVKKTI